MQASIFRLGLVNCVSAIAVVSALFCLPLDQAAAQYIKLDSPFQSNTESFYENIGVDFGFHLNGSRNGRGIVGLNPDGSFTSDGSLRFTQNGAGSAVPAFGGYDPNADATFGFGRFGGGGGFNLGLRMGQGNTRTSTSTTPSIVVPNGIGGSISDQIQRPFVTGVIPVVGTFPSHFSMVPPTRSISPIALKMHQLQGEIDAGRASRTANGGFVLHGDEPSSSQQRERASAPAVSSTATSGALSVSELRQQRESNQRAEELQRNRKVEELIGKATQSIEAGKSGVARIYLRQAIREASGDQKAELIQWYQELDQ